MPPEDIAEHALALAMCMESSDEANRELVETFGGMYAAYEVAIQQFRSLQVVFRQIASLNAIGRYKEAQALAADAASVDLVPVNLPPAPVHIPAEAAWPEIYSPTPR